MRDDGMSIAKTADNRNFNPRPYTRDDLSSSARGFSVYFNPRPYTRDDVMIIPFE